ncbi:MAG: hypothetical protein ACJ8FY_05735 [Gemmataceae bacterium]
MPTIVVSGALANKPHNGGEAWVRLNWILGFQKLGFRVYFVEEISRQTCVDARGAPTQFKNCVNLAYFQKVTEQFGLTSYSALVYEDGEQTYGLAYGEILDVAQSADLLINISGHLTAEPLMSRFCRKAYIDIDPGFTQFWQAAGNPGARLAAHDFYFTIGENIGTPTCSIPVRDIHWRRTRQPVVLDEWPVVSSGGLDRFTTVASWRGPYGPVQHGGQTFGLKVHEFRKFRNLPMRARPDFEIALSIDPADEKDLHMLRQHGWHITDPTFVAGNPSAFRRYVQASAAEFSVAQGIYVETASGWFSDRTVRYLASGKPALVQDTGFSRNYPVGEGLVAFRTLDEAVAGAEHIARDYGRQCSAARSIAEAYFDSDKVLRHLLNEVDVPM